MSRLMKKLKVEVGETTQSMGSPDVSKQHRQDDVCGDAGDDIGDADVQDSWEALADDEVCCKIKGGVQKCVIERLCVCVCHSVCVSQCVCHSVCHSVCVCMRACVHVWSL